jgi:hypothetical protein
MKNTISISLLALLILPVTSWGQDAETTLPSAPSSQIAPRASGDISDVDHGTVDPSSSVPLYPNPAQPAAATAAEFGFSNKFSYYMTETYFQSQCFYCTSFPCGAPHGEPSRQRSDPISSRLEAGC